MTSRSAFKSNKLVIAFFIVALILVAIIFINLLPQGKKMAMDVPSEGGGQVGASIGTPPKEAIETEQETVEPETEETALYKKQTINKNNDFGLFETKLKSVGFYHTRFHLVCSSYIY